MVGENNAAAQKDSAPVVDVVIVNWNSRLLLRECVAAIERSPIAKQLHVIVVDNASTDGSSDGLAGGAVEIVRNPTNRGFAAACNQGAARGTARFVLFLNPDVRVRPDAIANAASYMDDPANAGVGIDGARL